MLAYVSGCLSASLRHVVLGRDAEAQGALSCQQNGKEESNVGGLRPLARLFPAAGCTSWYM